MKYHPKSLKRFIVRDPKTRTIHASDFRDRIVHHLIVAALELIFEGIFIYDSYASRKNKGVHAAVARFEQFMRKVSQNGRVIRGWGRTMPENKNNVQGYVFKADIFHYFDNVDHDALINIIEKKVNDDKLIWLIRKVLNNFSGNVKGKGMPLGNYTSQFFANVYLNELDYFIKHELKAKYYIRYVDDFVILHRSKNRLEYFRKKIMAFLREIKLELHPEKSNIIPFQKGIAFLGYRIFYHYRHLRKRNQKHFLRKFDKYFQMYKQNIISDEQLFAIMQGWFGYAQWANTHNLREKIKRQIIGSILDRVEFE